MEAGEVPEDRHIALLTLAESIRRGRTDLISLLLKRHTKSLAEEPLPPSSSSSSSSDVEPGDTVLHLACRLPNVDAVRALLRSGMHISHLNRAGQPALRLAPSSSRDIAQAFYMELLQNVCSGNVPRVRELLDAQGGLTASNHGRDEDGTTLLHWAASLGQGRAMVAALLEGGADVRAVTSKGKTALDEARASGGSGNAECIAALEEAMEGGRVSSPPPPPAAGAAAPSPPSRAEGDALQRLRRKMEEQDSLIDSLRQTVDQLLRDNGVRDHVARLQDHVGALTRQLAATAEQRDKLQNLYVASDRELERVARELANKHITTNHHSDDGSDDDDDDEDLSVDELRERVRRANAEVDKERQAGFAAVRMHLTYEADLRAEIKALHEQLLLANAQRDAAHADDKQQDDNRASFFPSLW